MAQFVFTISANPHGTAYASDNPTRSTENYAHACHELLKDLSDETDFIISDGIPTDTEYATVKTYLFNIPKTVFAYALAALEDHRADDPISIVKPTATHLFAPVKTGYEYLDRIQLQGYYEGQQMLYKIWYMWGTEEDPLLLKEKLQELLIAWPLHDITVELNSELGQSFKLYPSWKNSDLG